MARLSIVHLLAESFAWGGAEKNALRVSERLAMRGHDVRLLSVGNRILSERITGKELFRFQELLPDVNSRKLCLAEWRSIFTDFPGDVLIQAKCSPKAGSLSLDYVASRCYKSNLTIERTFRPVLDVGKSVNIPVRGRMPHFGLWRWQKRLGQYRRSWFPDRLVCVSHALAEHLHTDYFYPRRKLLVVHNGIDTTQFDFRVEQRVASRLKWGVRGDEITVGFLGRLTNQKGLDILPDVLSCLVQNSEYGKRIKLVLVGKGPDESALRCVFEGLRLTDNVVFAGATRTPWEAYCGFDVFIMPSLTESFGMSLAEAMACGCLCVCTDVGGMPEIIPSSEFGWVVPPRNANALANAIKEALSLSSDRAATMKQGARERICTYFEGNRQLDRMCEVIEAEAMAGKKGRENH